MKKYFGIAILITVIAVVSGCSKNDTKTSAATGSSISGPFFGYQSGSFVAVSDIDVPASQSLTLAPGTVIKFQPGVKMTVHGSVNAVGDSLHMIQFTSAMPVASPGDWAGVYISGNTDTSIFKYCIFAYGNRFNTAYEQDTSITSNNTPGGVYKGLVSVNGSIVKLERCILYKGGWEGVEVQANGLAILQNCDLYKTSNSGLSVRLNGHIQVSNSNITSSFDCGLIEHDEYHGLHNEFASGGTFTGGYNNVWENRSAGYRVKPFGILSPLNGDTIGDPAYIDAENLDFNITPASFIIDRGDPNSRRDPDNSIADIGVYYFRQSQHILFSAIRGHLTNANEYHVVWDSYVRQGDTLTIDPGTVIKFDGYYGLTVFGVLNAMGTDSTTNAITFTSGKEVPVSGDWKNVFFNGNTTNGSQLNYCKFLYGSRFDPDGDVATGVLSATAANVDFNHILIRYTYNDGIHLSDGCGGNIRNVTIDGFGAYGVRCDLNISTIFQKMEIANGLGDGISISSNSSPSFTNVLICDNGVSGIYMNQLCSPTFNFVTVVNNYFDGITLHQNSLPVVRNSIIALNGRFGIDQQESSQATHDHNLFWYIRSDSTSLDSINRFNLFVNIENLINHHSVALDPSEQIANPMFRATGSTDQRYRLLDNSPAKNVATDGTDLGAFGGQGMN